MKHIILAALMAFAPVIDAQAEDKREGYYYPTVTSEEHFARVLGATPRASAAIRVNFINQVAKAQLESPETPRFAIFSKGGEAQHMIIVALDDDVFRTLFRARAVLAQLTSNARNTEFFVKNRINLVATWFDLAKILGFEDIVVSDGATWSHRVVLDAEPAAVPLGNEEASD